MPYKDKEKARAYDRIRDRKEYRKIADRRRKRESYRKDPVKQGRYLKYVCGITLADKERMYKNQEGLCGLCGEPLPENFRKAHTDHNHQSKKVRQLIHWYCNFAVGFEENHPGLLLKVLEYIKRWNS